MKTLVDISPDIVAQVQMLYKIKTKAEAIRFSLEEAIRRKKLETLANQLGSFENFITTKEFQKQKEQNAHDSIRVFCLD